MVYPHLKAWESVERRMPNWGCSAKSVWNIAWKIPGYAHPLMYYFILWVIGLSHMATPFCVRLAMRWRQILYGKDCLDLRMRQKTVQSRSPYISGWVVDVLLMLKAVAWRRSPEQRETCHVIWHKNILYQLRIAEWAQLTVNKCQIKSTNLRSLCPHLKLQSKMYRAPTFFSPFVAVSIVCCCYTKTSSRTSERWHRIIIRNKKQKTNHNTVCNTTLRASQHQSISRATIGVVCLPSHSTTTS